tara:strand:- start:112 stop:828 length:717 start_codon:yes stop_codon:yes gene_type:complete
MPKKKKIFKNTIGAWIQLDSITILKILENKKFDWICFDLEHGCTDLKNISKYLNVLSFSKKIKLIRINVSDIEAIPYYLDQGVQGFIIANVSNVDQIKKAFDLSRYPPLGGRGLGFSISNNFSFQNIKLNFRPYLIPIIENKTAIENINEICSSKIIDGIFIGPVDLSMSLLGKIDFENKFFKKSIKNILTVADKNNVLCGSHLIDDNKKKIIEMKKQGFSFVAYSTDSYILNKYYSI